MRLDTKRSKQPQRDRQLKHRSDRRVDVRASADVDLLLQPDARRTARSDSWLRFRTGLAMNPVGQAPGFPIPWVRYRSPARPSHEVAEIVTR